MRIGIDATCWANKRGYGRFARALLTSLLEIDRHNSYVFFEDSAELVFALPPGSEVVSVATRKPAVQAASADGRRSLGDLWRMSRAVSREQLDLFYFPSVYTFYPILNRVPKVVTIHDTIAEFFPQLVFPSKSSQLAWKAKVALGRWQATALVTVSDYSRHCLGQHFGIPSSRLWVVNEASDPIFQPGRKAGDQAVLQHYGVKEGEPFILYVGGFSPHKNLSVLLDAFRELVSRPEFGRLRLVLAGDYQGDSFLSCYRKLREDVAACQLNGRVVFTGYVPDPQLVVLFNHARVLALPSHLEGFGLPAIEAAACGTPVVATTASPLPGLLGAGGLYVKPDDVAGLTASLANVLTDPELHRRMSKAALQAASSLTWRSSAQQLLSIFETVAGKAYGKAA